MRAWALLSITKSQRDSLMAASYPGLGKSPFCFFLRQICAFPLNKEGVPVECGRNSAGNPQDLHPQAQHVYIWTRAFIWKYPTHIWKDAAGSFTALQRIGSSNELRENSGIAKDRRVLGREGTGAKRFCTQEHRPLSVMLHIMLPKYPLHLDSTRHLC